MNIALTGNPNPILDAESSADKLLAAIAAERELVILPSATGKIEYVQTGKNAQSLIDVLKSGQVKLIRSKSLGGPYYLGMFDQQGRLRILICRAPAIPPAQCPYRLRIGEKEVVNEFIESAKHVYGTPAVVCVCTTNW